MFGKKQTTLLLTALLALPAWGTTLGEMEAVSQPGAPLQAYIPLGDLDLDQAAIRVRIAKPSTYLSMDYEWPDFMRQVVLSRAEDRPGVVLSLTSPKALPEKPFDLVMQLGNDHPTFTVYHFAPEGNHWAVKKVPVKTKTVAAPVVAAKPVAAAPVKASQKARAALEDYIREHGDVTGRAVTITPNMTLWSLARAQLANYPGAIMEQVIVAFKNTNPEAFDTKAGPFKLVVGQTLTPPSAEAVFGVDALDAFKRVHPTAKEIPATTKNLIRAQQISPSVAADVAAVQTRLLREHRSLKTAAKAGVELLEQVSAPTDEAPVVEDVANANAPAVDASAPVEAPAEAAPAPAEAAPAPAEAAPEAAPEVAPEAAPAQNAPVEAAPADEAPVEEDVQNVNAPLTDPSELPPEQGINPADVEVKDAEAPVATHAVPENARPLAEVLKEAPKTEAAPVEATPKVVSKADAPRVPRNVKLHNQGGFADLLAMKDKNWWWLLLIPFLIWMLYRTFKKINARPEEKKKPVAHVKVDDIQKKEDVVPASDAQLKAVEATVGECVKNGTTAGAMGVGAQVFTEERMKAERDAQPWLDPESEELPPADDEGVKDEKAALAAAEGAMKGVDLSLDDPEPETKPLATPPKAEEPDVDAIMDSMEETLSERSLHEKALYKAIDAKLKLAQNFVRTGALKEARELLDEVVRRGLPQQQHLAKLLLDKIK